MCWPLILKKNRGSNQNGRTQCGDGTIWLYEMKKDGEKRMEAEHQKLVSRMIASADGGARLAAQDHETNGVESRSADSVGRRRRCQAASEKRGEEQSVGKALAM